jgi:hypothetical protein
VGSWHTLCNDFGISIIPYIVSGSKAIAIVVVGLPNVQNGPRHVS